MNIDGKFYKLVCKVKSCVGCDFWRDSNKYNFPDIGCFLVKHPLLESMEQLDVNEKVPLYR